MLQHLLPVVAEIDELVFEEIEVGTLIAGRFASACVLSCAFDLSPAKGSSLGLDALPLPKIVPPVILAYLARTIAPWLERFRFGVVDGVQVGWFCA